MRNALILALLWLVIVTPSLAQQPTINYQPLTTNGSNNTDTTWAMSLPKLATDGVYTYNLVMTGSDTHRHEVEIRRKKLNSPEPATTIWSMANVMNVGGLLMDKHGALHVFYFPLYAPDVYWSAFTKEAYATSPQSATVTFVDGNFPQVSGYLGVCYNCRLGLHYDSPTDTIHLSVDQGNTTVNPNISEAFYTKKVGTAGPWQPLTKVVDFYELPNGTFQMYFYPVLRVFKDKIHIFYTGNIADPVNPAFRWFNGIRHFYKDLAGSAWNSEWLLGPTATSQTYIVGNDSYLTPDNKLVVIGPYVEELGTPNQKLQLRAFVSSTGVGDWQSQTFYDRNASSCVSQTNDGKYNLFFSGAGAFLNWGQSSDGLNWTFKAFSAPTGYRQGLDANCLEDTVLSHRLSQPTVMVAGYNQALGQNSLSDGHSLVLAQVLTRIGLDELIQAISSLNIFTYNQIIKLYGQ